MRVFKRICSPCPLAPESAGCLGASAVNPPGRNVFCEVMFHPWQFVLQIGLTSPDGFRLGDGSCRAQILHAFGLLA